MRYRYEAVVVGTGSRYVVSNVAAGVPVQAGMRIHFAGDREAREWIRHRGEVMSERRERGRLLGGESEPSDGARVQLRRVCGRTRRAAKDGSRPVYASRRVWG